MAGETKELLATEHFRLKLGGVEAAGLFTSTTLPTANHTPTDFKYENDQAKPDSEKIGVQTTWADISMSRGIDKNGELWKWFAQGLPEEGKGGGAIEKKDITIEWCDAKGSAVITWNIKGAWPNSYSASALAAGGGEIGIENVSFAYHSATRQ